jgi:hypothetical protein
LQGLSWHPKWVSHLGCLKGCLDYLGVDVCDGWLYGATGHAFVLNIHDQLCPSGPTAWKAESIHRLGKNVGYVPSLVLGFKHQDDFQDKQDLAWRSTRAAIDEGVPCFGWELNIPEYYLIYGYDDDGYLYKGPGCGGGAGPKAWSALGDTGIGVLETYAIRPATPADDAALVRDALQFAIEYGSDPSPWTFDGYAGGISGYDAWIAALEGGQASGLGAAYNASVWSECRVHAAEFLAESSQKLSPRVGQLCQTAQAHYQLVADHLQTVAAAFPFVHGPSETDSEAAMDANLVDSSRRQRCADALRTARSAEEAGLQALADLLAALS